MKLQNIKSIDFREANKQIRDLKHLQSKFIRSRMVRVQPAQKLLVAIQKPMKRIFHDLFCIKISMVCERAIFEDMCSFVLSESENSTFQKSVCHSQCPQQSSVLVRCILNQRSKHMIKALQQIKYYALRKSLTNANQKLQHTKLEQLRKILTKYQRQERILLQVYLKYWSQQTQLIIFFDRFGSKINKVYKYKLYQYFTFFKKSLQIKIGLKKVEAFLQQNAIKQIKNQLITVQNNLHLQKTLRKVQIKLIKFSFEQLKYEKIALFKLIKKQQTKNMRIVIKLLKLYSLQQLRKQKSIQYGFQDLLNIIQRIKLRQSFLKMKKKPKINKTKYQFLITVLKSIFQRQMSLHLQRMH